MVDRNIQRSRFGECVIIPDADGVVTFNEGYCTTGEMSFLVVLLTWHHLCFPIFML